jgi:hypothetical protein
VTLVGVASPAQASHENWNWEASVPGDESDENTYVDGILDTWNRAGTFTLRICRIYVGNDRPAAHSARVQIIDRSTGALIQEHVFSSIAVHTVEHWDVNMDGVGHSHEIYVRRVWGDGAYGWREADFYWNWAGDQNTFFDSGWLCP